MFETIFNLGINDDRLSQFSLEWIIYYSWHQTGDRISAFFPIILGMQSLFVFSDDIK